MSTEPPDWSKDESGFKQNAPIKPPYKKPRAMWVWLSDDSRLRLTYYANGAARIAMSIGGANFELPVSKSELWRLRSILYHRVTREFDEGISGSSAEQKHE